MIQAGEEEAGEGALAFYPRFLAGAAAHEQAKQTGWGASSPTHHPGPRGHLVGRGLGSMEMGKLSSKRPLGESPGYSVKPKKENECCCYYYYYY